MFWTDVLHRTHSHHLSPDMLKLLCLVVVVKRLTVSLYMGCSHSLLILTEVRHGIYSPSFHPEKKCIVGVVFQCDAKCQVQYFFGP